MSGTFPVGGASAGYLTPASRRLILVSSVRRCICWMAIWLSLRRRSDCGRFSWMNRARRQRETVEACLFSKPIEFDGFRIRVADKVARNAASDLIAGHPPCPAVGKARGQARGRSPYGDIEGQPFSSFCAFYAAVPFGSCPRGLRAHPTRAIFPAFPLCVLASPREKRLP